MSDEFRYEVQVSRGSAYQWYTVAVGKDEAGARSAYAWHMSKSRPEFSGQSVRIVSVLVCDRCE